MRTASEFLGLTPPAPLPATLTVRPFRACVFVPQVEDVPWERMVEHALAAQTRVWGGGSNLIVPMHPEIEADEVFWRIVDRFDPDLVGLHTPAFADAKEITPDVYRGIVEKLDRDLEEQGFPQEVRAAELARIEEERFWDCQLPETLNTALLRLVAPLHLQDSRFNTVFVDGTNAPQYPLTDVAAIRELPESTLDIAAAGDDLNQLLLTHAVGRLLPIFRDSLAERGVRIKPVLIERDYDLYESIWPRTGVIRDFGYPTLLSSTGLMRRLPRPFRRSEAVVVVGDSSTDFLLFHGLSQLRPYIFWLPTRRLDDQAFVFGLREAIRHTAERVIGRNVVAITTARGEDAVDAAVELLSDAPGRRPLRIDRTEWKDLVPRSSMSEADANSERRVSLLIHDGESQSLPTPVPASVSVDEPAGPSGLRWMVDVHVEGWTPVRHRALAETVFAGPGTSSYDSRTTLSGPAYSGLAALVVGSLSLEGNVARPSLRPSAILDQLRDILEAVGWDVSLSDKGAFALQSAQLFSGVEGLANALWSTDTRRLLDAYLTRTTSNDPGLFVKDTRRRYLSLTEAHGVVEEADAATLVASLYDQQALIRGHVLKCEHCRATSFYSLSAEQEFLCVRCLTRQRATRFSWLEAAEPEFRYALAEVVWQFLSHNGHLPLLAAFKYFAIDRGQERQAFDIAFEVDLISPDGQRSEHDIVASIGAELWIGEATVDDKLGTGDDELARLERLRVVSELVSARGVLFVTTRDSFRQRTRTNISQVFRDASGPEIVFVENFDDRARPNFEN